MSKQQQLDFCCYGVVRWQVDDGVVGCERKSQIFVYQLHFLRTDEAASSLAPAPTARSVAGLVGLKAGGNASDRGAIASLEPASSGV